MKGSNFVWILYLNDMRSAHVETLQPVARAESREALVDLVARERVDGYLEPSGLPATEPATDSGSSFGFRCNAQTWGKTFRKGGPLEWYNAPQSCGLDNHYRHTARVIDYSDEIDVLPEVRSDAEMRAGAVDLLAQASGPPTHATRLQSSFVQPPPGSLVEVLVDSTLPFASGHDVVIRHPDGQPLQQAGAIARYRIDHVYNGGTRMTMRNMGSPPATVVDQGMFVCLVP